MRDIRFALVALAPLAVTGCGWVFPDDRGVPEEVKQVLDGVERPGDDCSVDPDRVIRVGTAPDPDVAGRTFELFVATTDGGGEFHLVRQLDENDDRIGNLVTVGSCAGSVGDEITWAGGQASGLNQFHAGRVPDGTESVVLHLPGGGDVTVPAIDGDYYFAVVSDPTWHQEMPQPALIEALDDDGDVIAELTP